MLETTPVRPSRARYFTLFWLCTMAGILYLDRVCWGKAAPAIKAEFDLTNTHLAYLMMAFQLAYGVFEIPTGRWGELRGARAILSRITTWWSIFTALTGACLGFWSLLFVRFLFGAGEAGAYPTAARVFTRWFPTTERSRAQSIMLTVSLAGGVIAPTMTAYLISSIGWRWTFVLFGSVGIVWALSFRFWFRDDPAQHSWVNASELALIRADGDPQKPTRDKVPWRNVFENTGILTLCAIIACSSFNSYFYMNWFPSYLESAHKITNENSGLLTSLALFGAMVGMLGGGFVADWIRRRSAQPQVVRRRFCAIAFALAAGFLFLAVLSPNAVTLSALAALSCLCVQLTLPSWWTTAIEQSGRHVGPIFGLMNMMGTVGALSSQYFVGVFADFQKDRGLSGREQWDPMFYVYVVVLLIGAVGWMLYRVTPLEDPGAGLPVGGEPAKTDENANS